jgi:hypothetical protein
MSKKPMFFFCVLLAVVLASPTMGQISWTDENGVASNHNWTDSGNWSSNEVPGEFDTVFVDYEGYSKAPEAHGPIIDSNVGWVAHLRIGGESADTPATLTISDGGLLRIKRTGQWPRDNGHFLIGQGEKAAGTLIMTGGKIIVESMCQVGKRPGQGLIKMSGNAEFIVDGPLKMGGTDGGWGDAFMQLDGGIVKCEGISMYRDESKMDITEGTLIAGPGRLGGGGTMENFIKDCVQNKSITAYNGQGTVKWKQDSPEKDWIEVWAELESEKEPNSPDQQKEQPKQQ